MLSLISCILKASMMMYYLNNWSGFNEVKKTHIMHACMYVCIYGRLHCVWRQMLAIYLHIIFTLIAFAAETDVFLLFGHDLGVFSYPSASHTILNPPDSAVWCPQNALHFHRKKYIPLKESNSWPLLLLLLFVCVIQEHVNWTKNFFF